MTNSKMTRRALLTSLMALVLCFAMLTGTTFAWFTDQETSGNNKIIAGNLDVEMYLDGAADPIDSNTKLFVAVKHWEPGVVAYENITVVNEGNLALKYQLSMNFADNGLAEALKVGVIEGGVQTTDRETVKSAVTSWKPIANFVENGELAVNDNDNTTNEVSSETYGIVIYWEPSDNDNKFNGNDKNATKEFSVDFGVTLFATQLMAEEDAFGPDYDENAPFSIWNGTVPSEMPETLVVDGATQTIHVKDADAFVYLSKLYAKLVDLYNDGNGTTYSNYANGAGANYYYSGLWTVSLEADIDLDNHPIDPVTLVFGESTGASAFKGNNHTIRNINTTTGLFENGNRASYADLCL
ncbi:MAG: hypothetical protein IJC80_01735, partial [Clostridia bacterium]|nr:hypothetical protein [Clostridia bacterium]